MNQNELIIEGRIVSIQREHFFVKSGEKEYSAHLAGRLRDAEEIPVVGDFVKVALDAYGSANILEVEPRKSFFARPDRKGHADGYVKP